MGSFTDHQIEKMLALVNISWISLHYENPQVSGNYASEVFGGSYERQRATFGAPQDRGITITNGVLFTGLPAIAVTHIGGWDAKNNGNMDWYAPLERASRTFAGGTLSLPADSIVLSIS